MAITFDSSASLVASAGSTIGLTQAWNHTVSGANTLLTVAIGTRANSSVTGVTYNGTPMTVARYQQGGIIFSYLFYLLNPAAGTNVVSATITGTPNNFIGVSASYNNVKQSGQPETVSGNFGGAAPITCSIQTISNNALIVDAPTSRVNASQVLIGQSVVGATRTTVASVLSVANGIYIHPSRVETTSTGTFALNYTYSSAPTTSTWGIVAASFAEAAATPTNEWYVNYK